MYPSPEDCETTSWQSKQKHAFLQAYLKIWTENVGGKPKSPSLDIVDLFASYGWCHSKYNDQTWEGTAILSAECLKNYSTKNRCVLYLNSYNPDQKKQGKQIEALTNAINRVALPPNREAIYNSLPIEQVVSHAAARIRQDYPNLWILDPYAPEALPWSALETILSLEGSYSKDGKVIIRRPELFITFMTYALQRNVNTNPHTVTTTLGLEENIWRPEMEKYLSEGLNTRQAIAKIFARRLEEFYGKTPIGLEVASTHGNIVYIVFFCTSHNAAYYMMKTYGIEEYTKWREAEWLRPAKEEAKAKKVDRAAEKMGHEQKRLF
jgi:three-Cys-motif partner protein